MSIAMHEWPRRHRASVEHYYRMAEAGLFAPDERVELIDGKISDLPPMGTTHAARLSRLVEEHNTRRAEAEAVGATKH